MSEVEKNMAISIKDPETDALARELARLMDCTITECIKRTLSEALAQQNQTRDQAKLAETLLMISERAAPYITHPMRSTDHGALLYDEMGLPK